MPSTAIDFHRLLVHFPVALILFAALFQVLAVWRSSATLQVVAQANLVGGVALGVLTALFGYLASSEFADRLLETHEIVAFCTIGCSAVVAALWLWKPSEPRSTGGFLALAGLALVAVGIAVTGYLGGDMAYGHGAHGPLASLPAAPPTAPAPPATPAAGTPELPAALQPDYALFAKKCTLCHGLDRPLGQHLGASAWPPLVQEMADKSGGAISATDRAAIVRFLQYYADHRTVRLPAAQ